MTRMNYETTIIPGSIDVDVRLAVKLKALVVGPDDGGGEHGTLEIHAAARHEQWGDDFTLRCVARVPMEVIKDASEKDGEEKAAELIVCLLREAIAHDVIDYIRDGSPLFDKKVGRDVELPEDGR